jgi:hypothetical protein
LIEFLPIHHLLFQRGGLMLGQFLFKPGCLGPIKIHVVCFLFKEG